MGVNKFECLISQTVKLQPGKCKMVFQVLYLFIFFRGFVCLLACSEALGIES